MAFFSRRKRCIFFQIKYTIHLDQDFQLLRISVIPIDHLRYKALFYCYYSEGKKTTAAKLPRIYWQQTAACMMTNLFKKILVCIVSQGEGSNQNFREFLMQMKSEGIGFFPLPSETECQDMEIFHRREIKSVGQIHWLAIHIDLVMESYTTARFQVRRDRGDGQGKSFC